MKIPAYLATAAVFLAASHASALPVSVDVYAGNVAGNPPDTFVNLGDGGVGPNGTRVGVASGVSAARTAAGTSNQAVWTIPGSGEFRLRYHLDNTVNAQFRPGIQGFYDAGGGVVGSAAAVEDALQAFVSLPGVSAETSPSTIPESLNSGSGNTGAPAELFTTIYTIDEGSPAIGMAVAVGFHSAWNGPGAYIFGREDGPNQVVIDEAPPPPPPPPSVTILPDAAILAPGDLITLESVPPGAPLRYTLDGSEPGAASTSYFDPFPLNESTLVRAVALDEEGNPGPIASRQYFVVDSGDATPNIVLIVGDEVGYGDLHCYGGVNIATPTLDTLFYEGIRFTQYTTTGGGAHAAQYALLTGRMVARSSLGPQAPGPGAIGWKSEEWSMGEMLRRRGYSTSFVGEWLLGSAAGSHPNDQGFQLFHGLPHSMAHDPPLEENGDVIEAAPDPESLLGQLTTRATTWLATAEEPFALVFHPPALPADGTSLAGPHGNRIEALDQAVAQLLAALDARNATDETLVIFLGNGGTPRTVDGGSNGLFRDGAGTTWEGGLRAPLIARWPAALPDAQMNLSLLWLPDLMPTLAAITGSFLAADRPIDGTPQPAVLSGSQTRPLGGETAFGLRHKGGAWNIATARQGRWKSHLSILNIDPENNRPTTGAQVYDLHVDAEERINRASQQGAVATELQNLADQTEDSFPPPGQSDVPEPKAPVINGVTTTLDGTPPDEGSVLFSFARPLDSIDDSYAVERSTNLQDWTSEPITPFILSLAPAGSHTEQLTLDVPLGQPPFDGPRHFVRLRADRATNP